MDADDEPHLGCGCNRREKLEQLVLGSKAMYLIAGAITSLIAAAIALIKVIGGLP